MYLPKWRKCGGAMYVPSLAKDSQSSRKYSKAVSSPLNMKLNSKASNYGLRTILRSYDSQVESPRDRDSDLLKLYFNQFSDYCLFKMWVFKRSVNFEMSFGCLQFSQKTNAKKSTLLLSYLKSICFRSFFGRIEDTWKTFWD